MEHTHLIHNLIQTHNSANVEMMEFDDYGGHCGGGMQFVEIEDDV